MEFTEEENRVIEAMARARCAADGLDPDKESLDKECFFAPAWRDYLETARRQYAGHREMVVALAMIGAARQRKAFDDIMGNCDHKFGLAVNPAGENVPRSPV